MDDSHSLQNVPFSAQNIDSQVYVVVPVYEFMFCQMVPDHQREKEKKWNDPSADQKV